MAGARRAGMARALVEWESGSFSGGSAAGQWRVPAPQWGSGARMSGSAVGAGDFSELRAAGGREESAVLEL